MPITVLPREEGFGTLIGRGVGSTLGEQLKDYQQKKKNRSFYENLATQLALENPSQFAETFQSLNPEQFNQFIYGSRYTGLPQMLGFGEAPQKTTSMKVDTAAKDVENVMTNYLDTLEKNIEVTEPGYSFGTLFKKPSTILRGDIKKEEFDTAGKGVVLIFEDLFRKATGRGLDRQQAQYVRDSFSISADMKPAKAEARLKAAKQTYQDLLQGKLPRDFPGAEQIEQEPSMSQTSKPQKIEEQKTSKPQQTYFEKLPNPKEFAGKVLKDDKGVRYGSDGKKWTKLETK